MAEIDLFERYIFKAGLADYYKSDSDLKLRLYHDLGIYGDVAEGCIETLRDDFNVDVSNFKFDDYFPEEFYGDNPLEKILFSLIPFIGSIKKNRKKFKPITFERIKSALIDGRLN